MNLNRVTITGADDQTDIDWMRQMQQKYPFVEWGILLSERAAGSYRFPSDEWLGRLTAYQGELKTSMHICGKWVREICQGDWDGVMEAVGVPLERADRVQLNFHSYVHGLCRAFFDLTREASANSHWQLIFQLDGVNNGLFEQAKAAGLDAVPLYDLSGGKGILPSQWPQQVACVYTGYAGGLGPDNVVDQIEKIRSVANGDIWIDMETRVRSDDDSRLQEELVESVLSQSLQFIK